jgi:hypothetical protein
LRGSEHEIPVRHMQPFWVQPLLITVATGGVILRTRDDCLRLEWSDSQRHVDGSTRPLHRDAALSIAPRAQSVMTDKRERPMARVAGPLQQAPRSPIEHERVRVGSALSRSQI